MSRTKGLKIKLWSFFDISFKLIKITFFLFWGLVPNGLGKSGPNFSFIIFLSKFEWFWANSNSPFVFFRYKFVHNSVFKTLHNFSKYSVILYTNDFDLWQFNIGWEIILTCFTQSLARLTNDILSWQMHSDKQSRIKDAAWMCSK